MTRSWVVGLHRLRRRYNRDSIVKKSKLIALVVLLSGGLVASSAVATLKTALLMLPRENAACRIGMDVGNRYPTLLLTYKVLPNGAISLHGWSGAEWVNVTPAAFRDGEFFTTPPESAIIVAPDANAIPEGLIPSEAWCPSVYVISTLEPRPLLHLIGRHYGFKYNDWKWFSENYRLSLNDINPEGLNIAWYHRQLIENLRRKPGSGNSDLQYLDVIRTSQVDMEDVPAETPVERPIESVTNAVDSVDSAEEDAGVSSDENPLTNAVPQAVILAPGDAEESGESASEDAAAENAEPDVMPVADGEE